VIFFYFTLFNYLFLILPQIQFVKKQKKHENKKFNINNRIVVLGIIVLCFVLYGKSISNKYNIDDDYVIEDHKLAQQGVKAIPDIFKSRYHIKDNHNFGYRPLTVAVFAIEYDVFVNIIGVKAESFPHVGHFFNIIYYIVCCSILFFVLKYLLRNIENSLLITLISTIIFIIHPIHTEVVLSLKNREEMIMLIFSLLALYQSIKYYETRKLYRLILGSVLLSLGFLAKESAAIFVAIIPLSIVFFKTQVKLSFPKSFFLINKGLFVLLVFLVFAFVLTIESFSIIGELKFDNPLFFKNNPIFFNDNKKTFLILSVIIFIVYNINLIYVIIKNKISFRKFIVDVFFIVGLILVVLAPIIATNTISLLLFIVLVLHINKLSKQKINAEHKTTAWTKRNYKWILPISISFISLCIIIISIFVTQKTVLPEINAPVYKWQNPIFERTHSIADRVSIAIYSLGYYLKLMVIPYPLRFYYGFKMIPDVGLTNLGVIFSAIIHLVLVFFGLKHFNKRKLISYAILFYLIAVIPFSNIVFPLLGIIGERLLFIASIGFSIALSLLIIKLSPLINKTHNKKQIAITALIITALISIPASAYTIKRNSHWSNRLTLYEQDIKVLENSAKANNLYANLLIAEVYANIKLKNFPPNLKERTELAKNHYKQALSIDSTYLNALHNLGYIYLIIERDYVTAKTYFDKCIELDSTLDEAYLNRGIANYYLNNYDQSIKDVQRHYKIAKSDENFDKVFYYTGLSLLAKGDTANGNENLLKTLEIPDVANVVIVDIKETFAKNQNFDLAIKATDILIERIPDADINYVEKGNYYLLMGDTVSAINNWEIAFEKYNGNFNIAMTLSQYWREKGNTEKAEYFTNKAIDFRNSQNRQQY
jgi:tetratricopeptide (TPR) repeat protein